MLKSLTLLRLAQNCKDLTSAGNQALTFLRLPDSLPLIRQTRSYSSFSEVMEKALAEHVETQKEVKEERNKNRKQRYNGKFKRRDWQPESEEAKRIRLEAEPGDRVKRKKALILLGYSGVNYCGMQRNPEVATIEEELMKTMLKHGWITGEGFKTPQQAFFQRAARTDKGVSAARQVVSAKLRKFLKF